MVAVPPSATSVTRPPGDTLAIVGAFDAHATARPVSVLPLASLSVTLSWTVPPTERFAVGGLTTTDATGVRVTVTAAVPDLPSLVAVMVAEPAATPVTTPTVTSPLAVTVATAALLVAHVTTRPLNGLPLASRRFAVSCAACPAATLSVAGLILTDATGTTFTVTAALPVLPSLVAVIVTAPAATPVTSPVAETVAVAGALDAQVIARPGSTVPPASFGLATSCALAPTSTSAVAGLITTEATGTFATVTAADPFLPSLVAVIVTLPAAMAVARPVDDTVAADGFELDHVIARPASTVPAASCVVAVSCTVAPTRMFATLGATATEATGTLDTVTVAVPVWPSLAAVMVAVPSATPLTRPAPSTVATAPSLVVHVTVRPERGFPFTSLRVAPSCTVAPIYTLAGLGLTVTEATARLVTVTAAVPLCPSLVAVMVADPTATPLTRPLGDTVAIALLLVVHVTVRPESTFPTASFATAVSCRVEPTDKPTETGLTETEATGTLDVVTVAVPLRPPTLAVTT